MEIFVLNIVLFQVVFVSCIGLFAFRSSSKFIVLTADEAERERYASSKVFSR
jgi:hypothetical protein